MDNLLKKYQAITDKIALCIRENRSVPSELIIEQSDLIKYWNESVIIGAYDALHIDNSVWAQVKLPMIEEVYKHIV